MRSWRLQNPLYLTQFMISMGISMRSYEIVSIVNPMVKVSHHQGGAKRRAVRTRQGPGVGNANNASVTQYAKLAVFL